MGSHGTFHECSWEVMKPFKGIHGKAWYLSWTLMERHEAFHGRQLEVMKLFMGANGKVCNISWAPMGK